MITSCSWMLNSIFKKTYKLVWNFYGVICISDKSYIENQEIKWLTERSCHMYYKSKTLTSQRLHVLGHWFCKKIACNMWLISFLFGRKTMPLFWHIPICVFYFVKNVLISLIFAILQTPKVKVKDLNFLGKSQEFFTPQKRRF